MVVLLGTGDAVILVAGWIRRRVAASDSRVMPAVRSNVLLDRISVWRPFLSEGCKC